jgi:hypothetical protein
MTTGTRPRRVVRGPIGCLVGALALMASSFAAEAIVARRGRQVVLPGTLPSGFPVIVLAGTSPGVERAAHLVGAEHLDRFLTEYPVHSFLIPEGREWDVARQLKSPDERFTGGLFFDSFNVERLSPGRQLITVNAPWSTDGFNIGRYEATDTEVTPRYLRRGGSLAELPAVVGLTLLFTLATLFLAAIAEWAWLKKKRQPADVGNPGREKTS